MTPSPVSPTVNASMTDYAKDEREHLDKLHALVAEHNATLEQHPEPPAPADEYERLKRQKDEIVERQERALVDASEVIAFWKRKATTTRDSNTLLREQVAANAIVIDDLVVLAKRHGWNGTAPAMVGFFAESLARAEEKLAAHERGETS